MKRFICWAMATFILGGIALTPGLLIYWFNEGVPVAYSIRKVMTPKVAPGDELKIKIVAEITKVSCKANVLRSIVDSAGVIHSVVPENRPAFSDYIVTLTVPLGAAPGPAKYRARVEWTCNPVQRYFPLVILQPEMEFEIVPVEGQMQMPEQQGIYQKPFIKSETARIAPE